jgi:mono/diheme cytochrome c family protein
VPRGLLVICAVASALLLAGCGSTGHTAFSAAGGSGGKKIFQDHCASCHALADAGSTATVGPDLDAAFGCARAQGFKDSTIRDVIRGQIDYASPPMPQKLVTGEDAETVSDYIASVAGTNVTCNGKGSLPEQGHGTP